MKSIKEWMSEKDMISEDFDKNALQRYFGSTQIEVDQNIRKELRPKIERIMDMDEYKVLPKEELLQKFKAVIVHIVGGMSGTTLNSRSAARKIDGEMSSTDISKFATMMGSEKMDVDYKLRRELKPKIERILDMDEYKDMPKSELEAKILAVVFQLLGEMSGGSMSISRLQNKFEQDPVAQESKLPSFLTWIENNEDAVSDPQHKAGEENMNLQATVEKRLMQMALDLESDGKGTRKEILEAIKIVLNSVEEKEEDQAIPDQSDMPLGDTPNPGQQNPGQQNPQF